MIRFHAIMLDFTALVGRGDTCRLNSISGVEELPQDMCDNSLDESVASRRFHCPSIKLGNFSLAANAELGSAWRSLDSWTGTMDSTHRRMQQVGRHLTGPAHITQGFPQWHTGDIETHKDCSLRESFSERVERAIQMLDKEVTERLVTEANDDTGILSLGPGAEL